MKELHRVSEHIFFVVQNSYATEVVLLFLMLLVPCLLSRFLARKVDMSIPDLGLVFTWILFLYGGLGLFAFILNGYGYLPMWDMRLYGHPAKVREIIYVGECYLAFAVGFSLFYGWAVRSEKALIVKSDATTFFVSFLLSAVVGILLFLCHYFLGDASHRGGYASTYLQFRHYPLLMRQAIGWLSQIEFTLLLSSMVFLFAWKPHLHRHAAIFILVLLLSEVVEGGSRALSFLLAFGYVLCYLIYVRMVSAKLLGLIGISGIVGFMIIGVVRTGGGIYSLLQGEFLTVYITSIDIIHKSIRMPSLISSYLIDVMRLLPQQLLPIEKIDPATWYVSTYYPAYYKAGGGFAFGSIAESVMAGGWIEALVRGGGVGSGVCSDKKLLSIVSSNAAQSIRICLVRNHGISGSEKHHFFCFFWVCSLGSPDPGSTSAVVPNISIYE